jgi:NAD-dependent deacetylase
MQMRPEKTMPNLVILTGAGISAESGILTFRDTNGLWENYRVEEVASPEGFRRDPVMVHRFYNLRRAQLKTVGPNAGHVALAGLERDWKGGFLLVTQNVDDLHERAGSFLLRHMHGEIRKIRCTACGGVARHEEDLGTETPCPACGRAGNMRPDIVWFGEMPYHMAEIQAALEAADIFVAIGTSGVVYPAAGFAELARHNGRNCETIEINPNPTGSRAFGTVIAETAVTGVPRLVHMLRDLEI